MTVFFAPKQGEISVLPSVEGVRELVASNRIIDARALLASAAAEPGISGDLAHWERVLAEPTTAVNLMIGPDHSPNYEWLRQNAAAHRGEWVALVAGELVANDGQLRGVIQAVRSLAVQEHALIHHIE